jgi:beta-N-acetylhexosaminidase
MAKLNAAKAVAVIHLRLRTTSKNQSLKGSKVIDEVLEGLAQAQVKGWWQPNDLSEARRLALLPTLPALAWDDLVRSVHYQQALACLP